MKHIIVVHGRNTKPAQQPYEDLQRKSLLQGLDRIDPAKADLVRSKAVKTSFVYYGDINNKILKEDAETAAKLTARDPLHDNAHCLPNDGYNQAIDDLGKIKSFTKARYHKILKENRDRRITDEVAWAISTIAAITTGSWLNEKIIQAATADMGAYLLTRTTGSAVRTRLQEPLVAALCEKDDICLVAHSMGSVVAYDVLWKLSRMSEYRTIQELDPVINLFLTIGSPLGEAGVRNNLYDAHERGQDQFPKDIIKDWINIAAQDDFISHDPTLANDFKAMRSEYGYVKTIKDLHIYNCYVQNEQSDPHKLFGYLAHTKTAQRIADWMG